MNASPLCRRVTPVLYAARDGGTLRQVDSGSGDIRSPRAIVENLRFVFRILNELLLSVVIIWRDSREYER